MSQESNSNSLVGILGLLGVALVALKLTKVIDWSWWYVTMPFWGGVALLAVIMFIAFIVSLFKD